MSKAYPPDGTWCWVRKRGEEWFPAERNEQCSGGWGNGDTWEDFDGEIEEWIVIPSPPEEKAE